MAQCEGEYEVGVTVYFDVTWEEVSPGKMGWEAVALGCKIGMAHFSYVHLVAIYGYAKIAEMEREFAANYEGEG